MNIKDISNFMYSIKEKLTDVEFKDIMDNLRIIEKKQTENDIYIFEYIKQKNKLREEDESDDEDKKILVNTIYTKRKKCLIKFNTTGLDSINYEKINRIIENVNIGNINNFDFFFNIPTNEKNENKLIYKILDVIDDDTSYEFFNKDVLVRYKNIIPLSFKPYTNN